jgi:hypothetical protein
MRGTHENRWLDGPNGQRTTGRDFLHRSEPVRLAVWHRPGKPRSKTGGGALSMLAFKECTLSAVLRLAFSQTIQRRKSRAVLSGVPHSAIRPLRTT